MEAIDPSNGNDVSSLLHLPVAACLPERCSSGRAVGVHASSIIQNSSEKHKKWLYAMSIVPMKEVGLQNLSAVPDDITDNPFLAESIQKREDAAQVSGNGRKTVVDSKGDVYGVGRTPHLQCAFV